jgi:hypothetical protein
MLANNPTRTFGRGKMKKKTIDKRDITEQMVLVGIALGALYWFLETVLYVFTSYQISFISRLFGPDLSGICTRLIVLCLFLIFGSHAQYTFKERKYSEDELKRLKEINEKLQREIMELKKA